MSGHEGASSLNPTYRFSDVRLPSTGNDKPVHGVNVVSYMSSSNRSVYAARAYTAIDARRLRPNDVRSTQGLPCQGRARPRKLVHKSVSQGKRTTVMPLRFCTLNVGTLTGRHREVAAMLSRRKVDVCCLQETKWKGSKARALGDGYKLLYHGTKYGTGIVVSEKLADAVT